MTDHDDDRELPDGLTPDEAKLDRHLAGETPPPADDIVRDDVRPRVLAALSALDAQPKLDTAAAWRAVRDRTIAAPATIRPLRTAAPIWHSTVFRIAASIVLLAGAATVAVKVAGRGAESGVSANERLAETATGERRDVLLPDGTRVALAPKSRLMYPATFAAGRRDVQLAGEAFFVVAHDSARPFTVHTTSASARVLGTEFGVRAHEGHTVDVYVASGRVRVAPARDTLGPVLAAGDLGHVAIGGGSVVVTHNAAISDYLAWRDGRVVANARPAAEVLDELGRWFDVRFSIADSKLAARTVSVDLRVGGGASLESTLDALMLVLDARYSRDGNVVTVRAR